MTYHLNRGLFVENGPTLLAERDRQLRAAGHAYLLARRAAAARDAARDARQAAAPPPERHSPASERISSCAMKFMTASIRPAAPNSMPGSTERSSASAASIAATFDALHAIQCVGAVAPAQSRRSAAAPGTA